MNKDIRISIGFLDHPKTIKLKRILGSESIECLLRLWSFAAQYKPSGKFNSLTEEDLEIASQWHGETGKFLDTLKVVGLIDKIHDELALHDWIDHNPYVTGADDRSNVARFNKMKGHYPDLHKELVDKGYKDIDAKEYQRMVKEYLSRA